MNEWKRHGYAASVDGYPSMDMYCKAHNLMPGNAEKQAMNEGWLYRGPYAEGYTPDWLERPGTETRGMGLFERVQGKARKLAQEASRYTGQKVEFHPMPIVRLEFTETERRLFELLPHEEQMQFARAYFAEWPNVSPGLLADPTAFQLKSIGSDQC